MTSTLETPLPPDVPPRRRRTDRAVSETPAPTWLEAPLTATDEPAQGNLVDPSQVRFGDYILEYSEQCGTASWLRVQSATVIEGRTHVWYGENGVLHIRPIPGMRLWVLRQDEAQAILRGRRLVSELTSAQFAVAVEQFLRFTSKSEMDAAWDLVHAADGAETDSEAGR